MHNMDKTYYELLKIEKSASDDEIRAAFLKLSKEVIFSAYTYETLWLKYNF